MSDIANRFAQLQNSLPRLKASSAKERAEKLQALWSGIVARKEDLFEAGRKERRSHEADIAAELVMIKGEIDYICKNLAGWMKPKKIRNSMATMGKRCEIRYEPKGTVLNLSAWNAPTAISIVPLLPAIAAGNAVALKPSELAPHSADIVEEIVRGALPAKEADVFQGGAEVAQELLTLPFGHIYYTGGYTVGSIVMKAAADHFASVTLEMGGKSPVIVDKSASLENAVTKIVWGRAMNAGQVCVAPDYAIVHEDLLGDFIKLAKDKVLAMYDSEGSGLANSRYMPRVISKRHHQRITGLIDDAVAKGAKIAVGGEHDIDDLFIAPTFLTNVSEDMKIMNEEVFGPVMAVTTFKNREEVPAIIERRPKPLALYIYSTDDAAIKYFLSTTTSGSAVVNNNCIQSGTNPRLPFGGVGHSGMGRVGGFRGFEEMSNARSVVHQPLGKLRDILIQMPPYSDRYQGLIMKGLK